MEVFKKNHTDWRWNKVVRIEGKDDMNKIRELFIKYQIPFLEGSTFLEKSDDNYGDLVFERKDVIGSSDYSMGAWRYGIINNSVNVNKIPITVDEFEQFYKEHLNQHLKSYNLSSTNLDILSSIKTIDNAPQMIKDLNKIMMDTFGMDISITLNIPK